MLVSFTHIVDKRSLFVGKNKHWQKTMVDINKKNHELGWLDSSADKEFFDNNNKKQASGNVVTSLVVAFFIVVVSAQILGLINGFFQDNLLREKYNQGEYNNAHVIVYSNRC